MKNDTTNSVKTPLLKFSAVFKQKLWGGQRILPFKGMPAGGGKIGESWEISGIKGCETCVSGGIYDGVGLASLLAELKERLVGHSVYKKYSNEFPLLVKFIDAADDLSIQVHPDDTMAHKYGYPNGKTEMWYVIGTSPGAHITSGFKKRITPEEYKAAVADDTIGQILCDSKTVPGDCFFVPAGRVHSIGRGTMVAEIQQSSDITYRIYDYNRRDANGNLRELHTELAAEAINYDECGSRCNHKEAQADSSVTIVSCDKFVTRLCNLRKPFRASYADIDSFIIYTAFSGSAAISDGSGCNVSLRQGECMLVPAETSSVSITPGTDGIKFLETYIPATR